MHERLTEIRCKESQATVYVVAQLSTVVADGGSGNAALRHTIGSLVGCKECKVAVDAERM